MEVFQVPRRQVRRVFGIARSTYYCWLDQAEDGTLTGQKTSGSSPANKTNEEVASLVWRIFASNPHLGREKIAQMVQRLNVFLSPSGVRHVLRRARPQGSSPKEAKQPKSTEQETSDRVYPGIVSKYPNHVWSVDLTVVKRWLVWPTYVLVAIDHYSRKVVRVSPLEGPNSGWTIDALDEDEAMNTHGKPKHLISDQGSVFIGKAFADLMEQWTIQHRFGAVGKYGSIAVTERVIKTLKEEWLNRVPLIKGFDHLTELCSAFFSMVQRIAPSLHLEGGYPG